MDANHKLLRNEELFFQSGEIIKDNITAIKTQLFMLRDQLAAEKQKLLSDISSIDSGEQEASHQAVIQFYNRAIDKLVTVEETCHEYLVNMKIDLLSELKGRMQPPTYTSLAKVKKTYDKACVGESNPFKIASENCHCNWTNVLPYKLENTLDIVAKPRRDIPTEFDEWDLKFKQEMTTLRTKIYVYRGKEYSPVDNGRAITKSDENKRNGAEAISTDIDVVELIKGIKTLPVLSIKEELSKVNRLRFADAYFVPCDIWAKILDIYGHQMRSKWYLAVCPQISKILKYRHIASLHLDPSKTFEFLLMLRDDFFNLILSKDDVLTLADSPEEGGTLCNWKQQFKFIEGKSIAATLIQTKWRGYRVRKRMREELIRHFAGYQIWIAWLALKKKRERRDRYVATMLVSTNITHELRLRLRFEFDTMVQKPHVVIHIPSLGYVSDIRRTLDAHAFSHMQNTMSLRVSFLRNPKSEVIYVLPVIPTENLVCMNDRVLTSVASPGFISGRLTYLPLSLAKVFERRSFNVSRLLHLSEKTIEAIRQRIIGKPAYILPWIVDECDIKVASILGVPILAPEMDLQQELLHASKVTEIIENLDLRQPAHVRDIRDYASMCAELARLIVVNTEVCLWTIRLNVGTRQKHYAKFLINHVSIPFMPILRHEKQLYGDEWNNNVAVRTEYLDSLLEQLPKVVWLSRLANVYENWKEFYAHVQKYGCLLQAVPNEKDASIVCVGLFVPDKATGQKARWIGTANKLSHETGFSNSPAYLIPHGTVDKVHLEPLVNKFTKKIQEMGFIGYLTLDWYCYTDKRSGKLMFLLLHVHPNYSHVQLYVDWVKFAVNGSYNFATNSVNADLSLLFEAYQKKISGSSLKIPEFNETAYRYAVVVPHLYHTNIAYCQWNKLEAVLEECEITFNTTKKEGVHMVLYDGETNDSALIIVISSSMATSLSTVHTSLKKIQKSLTALRRKGVQSNLRKMAKTISSLPTTYYTSTKDSCN